MKFGSQKDAEGNPINADSTSVRPEVGFINNVEIEYVGLDTDREGETVENRSAIVFKQPNGARVKRVEFEPNEDAPPSAPSFEQQRVNVLRTFKHVLTKISGVDEDTFNSQTEDADSFKEFIKKCSELYKKNINEDEKFRVKFCYPKNSNYVKTSLYPNFIESAETAEDESTLSPFKPGVEFETPQGSNDQDKDAGWNNDEEETEEPASTWTS